MTSERYRIFLIPDASGPPPVPMRRRPRSHPKQPDSRLQDVNVAVGALLNAFGRVCRRGTGPAAWAPVMDDPLAFLLDAMSDAVVVRGPDGALLFANPQAQEMGLGQRSFAAFEEFDHQGELFRCRGLRLDLPDGQLTLSLVSRIRRT